MRKLRDVEEPLANFLASGIFNLREKLGPILWQFPPNFKYDRGRMESFLDLLPHDTLAACGVARKRSAWMKGRTRLAIDARRALRHAVEVRHESFLDPSFIELLRSHNVALVVAETARRWPMTHDVTADFVYMRLHGDKELYRSGYGDKALDRWARRIQAWSMGKEPVDAQKVLDKAPPPARERDVYCFFDNTDVKLRAPVDAQTLMRKLGLEPGRGLDVDAEPGRARDKTVSQAVVARAKAGAPAKRGAGAAGVHPPGAKSPRGVSPLAISPRGRPSAR
jgi:uncharacterized protein YecE (DUF72 family)